MILTFHHGGPAVSVQDAGRDGWLEYGLSRGGAADRLALAEGAALLGQSENLAALEMAGTGGSFSFSAPARIALTGAPMAATLDGHPLRWNAVHRPGAGQMLRIGAARQGVYGYLHVGGGIDTPALMGSRSAHLAAGLGGYLAANSRLPIGKDPQPNRPALALPADERFSGGTVRMIPTPQTPLFSTDTRARFTASRFTRSPQGNRQGVRLDFTGSGFCAEGQLDILTDFIIPGDIQMTGNGSPFVLLQECQTTGGYPRIGTVLPQDLPIVAQAAPGAKLRFGFVTPEQALADYRTLGQMRAKAAQNARPLVRDPRTMPDLLSYQLISGAISGTEGDPI